MDPIWLLLLLPFAAGSGWLGAARALAQKRQREVSLPSAYFKGLNFLLNEQRDKALEVLVTALEQDKETVEVQLALGSLFRKRGEIQRATRVHQNLVARTQLDDLENLVKSGYSKDYGDKPISASQQADDDGTPEWERERKSVKISA